MATPNIVPRADSEGGVGTSSKYWASAYIDTITTTSHIVMPDNALLKIGTGTDLTLQHNGSNSYILNATGDLYITNNADDKDIIFQSDDGSGGAATYMTIDGSAVKILMQKSTVFTGGGMDFGVDDTGADVIFYGATSGRNMKWDESEDHLLFTDNTKLKIGTGSDLNIYHNASNSYIEAQGTGNLYIMQNTDDADLILACDDGSGSTTAYLTLDGSVAKTAVSKPLLFADNISAEYGADTDMIMYHSGGAGYIEHYNGNFNIIQHTNDGDILFQCDDGSGGVTTYITIDGSATQTKFDKNARFNDSVRAEFGSSGDFVITHDGSDSKIENATGDLKIRNFSDDKDIIFENDNGAGGSTTYFYLDGSSATHDGSATTGLYTNWPDYSRISMGTSHDLQIYHDSTNSNIINAVGNLAIQNNADDGDIKFFSDDGSGGVTEYFRVDGGNSQIRVYKELNITDSISATFGNTGDLSIQHDGTDSKIHNDTGHLIIEIDSDDKDLQIFADDQSGGLAEYFRIDGSLGVNRFIRNTSHNDSVIAKFGTGNDLQIQHDGSNSYINANGTGDLYIKQMTADQHIYFQNDDGSGGEVTYLQLDGANVRTTFTKPGRFLDNIELQIGLSADLKIYHDATDSRMENYTGNLTIQQRADDKDILFQCDDGSGGLTDYMRIDGSHSAVTFADNIQATFGTSRRLSIKHDGTDATITETNGDLNIINTADDKDIVFKCDDGSGGTETYFFLDGSANGSQPLTVFPDNSNLGFGSASADAYIHYNGTNFNIDNYNGAFYLTQHADDADLIFRCDDGSGNVTAYITLDGSDVSTIVSTIKVMMPNLPTSNPSTAGQLWNDSGTLKISAG